MCVLVFTPDTKGERHACMHAVQARAFDPTQNNPTLTRTHTQARRQARRHAGRQRRTEYEVAAGLGEDEVRGVLDVRDEALLVLGHAEEVGGLLHLLEGHACDTRVVLGAGGLVER